MRWTPFGRSFYAIGVNPAASVYAGIDVGRTKFFVFCISGAVAGLVGLPVDFALCDRLG